MALAAENSFGEQEESPLRLSLIRSFEVSTSTGPVTVPGGIQRVVAYLALTDRVIGRTRLAGTLWPETSDERSNANLRCCLWRLRQIPVPLVEAAGGQLRLDPQVSVDLHEALAQAKAVLEGDTLPSRIDYRSLTGDLLEDWYDDWVQVERERYRQVRLHALEACCERLVEAGRYVEAIDAGLAAVEGEPLRESAQAALIRAYLAEGNRSEAIRQYRSYQRVLDESLGLEPTQALQALVSRSLQGAYS